MPALLRDLRACQIDTDNTSYRSDFDCFANGETALLVGRTLQIFRSWRQSSWLIDFAKANFRPTTTFLIPMPACVVRVLLSQHGWTQNWAQSVSALIADFR